MNIVTTSAEDDEFGALEDEGIREDGLWSRPTSSAVHAFCFSRRDIVFIRGY